MNGFESVFGSDDGFDTMFGGQDDGHLIDMCCGMSESGTPDVNMNDFDDLHHEDDYNATPSDWDDLGPGNDAFAPKGAEGTDGDPAINLAMGETADSDFSADGKKGKTAADAFYAGYDAEVSASMPGEGPDLNMDPEDLDGEFDKMVSSAVNKTGTATVDMNHESYEDYFSDTLESKLFEGGDCEEGEDCDSSSDEEFEEMVRIAESKSKDSDHGYEEGDSDLVDLVDRGNY